MTDERLQILRMVEEGKVSADEAVKLLEALGDDKGVAPASPASSANRYSHQSRRRRPGPGSTSTYLWNWRAWH